MPPVSAVVIMLPGFVAAIMLPGFVVAVILRGFVAVGTILGRQVIRVAARARSVMIVLPDVFAVDAASAILPAAVAAAGAILAIDGRPE